MSTTMSRRSDPIRILNAQLAGTRQRLADLEILIAHGKATEADRAKTLDHFDQLTTQLEAATDQP